MPKFQLKSIVSVSATTIVEADSPEHAKEIAEGRSVELDGYGHSDEVVWLISERTVR